MKKKKVVRKQKEEKDVSKRVRSASKEVKSASREPVMGFKKQCFKTRPVCRVTFRFPKEAAPDARNVIVAGDFNNWDKEAHPMKKLRNGNFAVTLELEKGRKYQFRYLIDGDRWENDWHADMYEPNPFGGNNSVVAL
jgi:1,4-alpha-glucan branching enzyme